MIHGALCLAGKDLRLLLSRGTAFAQSLLLGLLLLVLFSLAAGAGVKPGPETVAAVFWMASAICQVLVFNALYALEEGQGQRLGLLLAPIPPQAVWLGKAVSGFVLLCILQIVFLLGAVVLLDLRPGPLWPHALLSTLAVDAGIVLAGSLIGPMAAGDTARDSLAGILLFPVLMPLFLAGIRCGSVALYGNDPADLTGWLGLALGFDLLFACLGLLLYPFVFSGE